MRPSTLYVIFLCAALGLSALSLAHARWRQSQAEEDRARNSELVRTLQLTDLALFTEARYTRHLSMADVHSAFQDHPGALEHFPSGSLVAPPLPWRQIP